MLDHWASNSRYLLVLYILWWSLIMRNKSTLFYLISQVKVFDQIYWQKSPVTFKLCKSLENSTGHGPGGHHYCRTMLVLFKSIGK